MGEESVGNGGIKSIQQATITLTGVASNTATISSVDTSKSFVLFGGYTLSTAQTADNIHTRVALTNATTVTATRVGSTADVVLGFTVVEFY